MGKISPGKKVDLSSSAMSQETYSPEGLRIDGRRWNELRRFECSINTHPTSADGSSYLEMGSNKIITLVEGPKEPKGRAQLDSNGATLTITLNMSAFSRMERKKISKSDKRVLEMENSLVRIFAKNIVLKQYPRTSIDVSVHVLQQDGGIMGAIVNGITLALIDAGIAMYDYISGVSVGLYDTQPLLDLNTLEENAMSCVTLGVVGKSEKLSLLLVEDKVPLDRLESVLAIGIAGCHQIRSMMDVQVRKHGGVRLSKAAGALAA